MSKPMVHARNSVRRWGGEPEDYVVYHDWFDQSKAADASMQHRMFLHHALGIYLCEQQFGHEFVNSAGRTVQVRDVAEQHVLDDLGFIPSLSDWVKCMPIEPWMAGTRKAERRKGAVLVD